MIFLILISMYMHPTDYVMSSFSVADFIWKDGYLTTQRDDFSVKISSTKVIFNFTSFDRLNSVQSYAKRTAKFIADIADECYLNNSEIFITHFINKMKAYVEIEHADFGHTNFNTFMNVFNGNQIVYPQVDLLPRVRLPNLPVDFQYLMDMCEQYCEVFPIRDENLNRIEQVLMNRKFRDSSWPVQVRLNELKDFIDKYAIFPNCDEIVIDKRIKEKAISYTRNRYRGNPSLKHFDETTEVKYEFQVLSKIILQRLINDQSHLNEDIEALQSKINNMERILSMCMVDAEDFELYNNSIQKTVHFQDSVFRCNICNPIGLGKTGLGKYPRKRLPRMNDYQEHSTSSKIIDSQLNGYTDEASSGKELFGKDTITESSPCTDDPWRASDLQSKGANMDDEQSTHSHSSSPYNRD